MLRKTKVAILSMIMVGAVGLIGCSKENKVVEKEELKVTLILDEGGVNDQSFNQSAWEGALNAKEQYGVNVSYIEAKQESDYLQNIETAIDNESDLIIGVGFKLADAINEASASYPNQKFAIIDGSYDKISENVHSILFNEEQAGYCAGLIASQMTKTNVVGFIGGMDIPSCSQFGVGFEKAMKEVNANSKVLTQFANSFTDASKGRAISEQMINNNADIIFTAGGGVNTGTFETCKEKGIYAIGVDMPSNHIMPDTIITSAVKNIGLSVEYTIKDLLNGEFKGGESMIYDLSNGGVGYEKTDLIPKEVIEFVENKMNK